MQPHRSLCSTPFSAGYGSAHAAINPKFFRTLLDRGDTVFAVVHGSAPKFSVPEIEPDIYRAARFVRHHAARFGLDPQRIGAIGASAGGHLALMLATKGDPAATDPVDRESSAGQCAVGFFPPTDYLNYGAPGREAAWIGPLLGIQTNASSVTNFAAQARALCRDISPIYFIHSNQPPLLIFQGDKDYLVPVDQARTWPPTWNWPRIGSTNTCAPRKSRSNENPQARCLTSRL